MNAFLDINLLDMEQYNQKSESEFPWGYKDWKKQVEYGHDSGIIYNATPDIRNQVAIAAFTYPEGDENGGRKYGRKC